MRGDCLETKEFLTKKNKKLIITIGTIVAVYFGFKYLLPLFVPFIFAYFVAWILRPIVSYLHRRLKVPVAIGGSISLLLLLIMLGTGIFYIGRMFINQLVLFLKNMPVYEAYISNQVEYICVGGDKLLGLTSGTMRGFFDNSMDSLLNMVQNTLLPKMTMQTLKVAIGAFEFFTLIIIVIVSILLFIKDMESYKEGFRKSPFYSQIHKITKKLSSTGTAYLKTQVIIMGIIAVICVAALFIIKNPYAILIGIAVGVFDAFPILGSGLILVPWSIVLLFQKNYFDAAILMSAYLVCQFVREIVEPKLLGNKLGIKPIYSMMAMYIGVQLFGFAGFFLGPFGLIIIRTVIKTYT